MRRLKRAVQTLVQGVLQPVETRLRRPVDDEPLAPLFIVGPPRSGSTLLYQLMVRRYRFCYLSNLMMKFPGIPLSIAKATDAWGGFEAPEDFSSRYGNTSGWRAPSQGLQFWTSRIPHFPHELAADAVSGSVKLWIRDTVLAMQRITSAPFINKWPPNSLRILLLADIFPNALFIRITRTVEPMVQSILRSRQDICHDGSGWFSVKPPGHEDVLKNREAAEQARWQVECIENTIDRTSAMVGVERFLPVRYEELTLRPREILGETAAFYQRITGKTLQERGEVPHSFESRTSASALRKSQMS